jgi:hypothetical protein
MVVLVIIVVIACACYRYLGARAWCLLVRVAPGFMLAASKVALQVQAFLYAILYGGLS